MKPEIRKCTDEEIAAALMQTRGMVTLAARNLNINRATIYLRMEANPALKEVLAEAREYTGDVAEQKLFEAIQAGEGWAIRYYLNCQARDRGYSERTQVEHSGTVRLDVTAIRERVEARLEGINQRLLEKPRQE